MRAYLTDKKSIGNVIAAMTVEEKALLITGKSKATSNAFEKFGIPAIVSLDGISGINLNQYYMEAYTQNQLAENPGIEARIREGSEGMLQINEGLAAVTEGTEKGHRAANLSPEAKKIVEYTDKNMLTDSIERASLFAKEGRNNLIKISVKDDNLQITSKSEAGDVNENIPVKKNGSDIEIGFNSKYLLDGLKAIRSDDIVLKFNTNVTPCILEPVGDENFTYLLLPVRIMA